MLKIFVVALGGACGAIARYVLSGAAQQFTLSRFGRVVPAGTFAVNVLGCLLIGVLMVVVHEKRMSETARLLWITGFLGSLTTFSTFGYETLELWQAREMRIALGNILANVLVGLAAVWIGQMLASSVLRP